MIEGGRILVTGATGEVARRIALSLAGANEVWAAARFTDPEARKRLEEAGIRTFAWSLGDDSFPGLPEDLDHVVHAACNIFPVADDFDGSVRTNAEGTGFLMRHCRAAKAFLYVSSLCVYSDKVPLDVPRKEEDALGAHPSYAASYAVGKISTEAVVRMLCRLYGLPVTIARLGMNYGIGVSGVPDFIYQDVVAGKIVPAPPPGESYCALIHNDDVIAHVEPLLNAASVPATIVNWCGDEMVDEREMYEFVARIAGVEPRFEERSGAGYRGNVGDPARRRAITGPTRPWKPAFVEMMRANYPDRTFADAG
jgi:nucleoside-diphosphate-sugar epimerase